MFDLNSTKCNDVICKTRVNSDTIVNNYGRLHIDLCKVTNMKIINGRIGSDGDKGDLTFNGPTGKSTIDYCIASHDLFPHIQDFSVDIPDQSLSDAHSPIILTLKNKLNNEYVDEITVESDIKYDKINSIWCDNKKSDFQSNFDQDKIDELRQLLITFETIGTNQTELDNTVKEISSISTTSGINTGISKQAKNSRNNQKTNKVNKPWFDQECLEKIRQFKRIKERLRKSRSYSDREALKTEYKLYKNVINRKRNIYNKNLHKELRNLKSSKPKEYWNLLNPKKNKPNNSLGANSVYNNF